MTHKNAFCLRVIKNEIRVSVHFDRLSGLKSLRVKHGHSRALSIRDESTVQVRNDCDSVYPGRILDLANHFTGVRVQNVHFVPVGNVETIGRTVENDVIEAAVPRHWIPLRHFEAGSISSDASCGE